MFAFITRMPIFRRLFFAFSLAAIVPGIVILVLGTSFISTLNTRSQAQQINVNAVTLANQSLPYLQDSSSLLNEAYNIQYNLANPQSLPLDFLNRVSDAEQLFDRYSKQYQQQYAIMTSPNMALIRSILLDNDPNTTIPQQQQQLLQQEINVYWPRYQKAEDKLLLSIQKNAPLATVQPLLAQANDAYPIVEITWDELVNLSDQISQQVTQVGPSQINPVIVGVAVALLVTMIAIVIIGYMVNITIVNPLRQLAALTQHIADGKTDERARIIGQDEISTVARSMNNMLDNIVLLIQETKGQRDNLQGQVEKLVSEVSCVGEGDLRIQAEVTADTLGVLADSFNYMVEELSSLVVRVKSVAHDVENFTVSILDRMSQLVETGDIQIHHIEEARSEVEQMAGWSRQVAERAQVLRDLARNAQRSAYIGRQSGQQAMHGIGRINDNVLATSIKVQSLSERSREIEEIVNVIGSIAHQTQRLALDAAIQAAMAGENGKGFAAIATDIRRLSERAKDQTGSIARIVRSVREEIGAVAISMQDTERETANGTTLTNEVSVSLETMFTVVERQAQAIEAINVLATQQLRSSSAVVQIIQGVSGSTRQSSVSTREASQDMQRLAMLVEQLRASVEAFKLRDNQGHYPGKLHTTQVSLEDNGEDHGSLSSLLRTVSASAHRSTVNAGNALPMPTPIPTPTPRPGNRFFQPSTSPAQAPIPGQNHYREHS